MKQYTSYISWLKEFEEQAKSISLTEVEQELMQNMDQLFILFEAKERIKVIQSRNKELIAIKEYFTYNSKIKDEA